MNLKNTNFVEDIIIIDVIDITIGFRIITTVDVTIAAE